MAIVLIPDRSAFEPEDLVDRPTGHWSRFTRPREPAAAILAAVQR